MKKGEKRDERMKEGKKGIRREIKRGRGMRG